MKQSEEIQFEELIIPRKEVQNLADTRYRVYSDSQNWEVIEASSALEALQKSGSKKAYKIERHNPLGDNVLQIAVVEQLLGGGAAVKTDGATKEVVEIAPTPPALSGEEVDKLLNQPQP